MLALYSHGSFVIQFAREKARSICRNFKRGSHKEKLDSQRRDQSKPLKTCESGSKAFNHQK